MRTMTWNIEGTIREALVSQPPGVNMPILFAFHGHAGTAEWFSHRGFELLWPEAIVVYPQGIETPTPADPSGNEAGWQDYVGEVSSHTNIIDQDLKFFDEMMKTFMPAIDPRLVFVHGYSNGGGLAYNVLWTLRGEQLAGLAVVAATVNTTANKIPTNIIHFGGKKDPVVSFSRQQDTISAIRRLNKCLPIGVPCYTSEKTISSTRWWSFIHKPVIFGSHEGDHTYPDAAPKLITKHFMRRAYVIQTSL